MMMINQSRPLSLEARNVSLSAAYYERTVESSLNLNNNNNGVAGHSPHLASLSAHAYGEARDVII